MITALEGGEGHRHAPAAVYPRERPGPHSTGDWVGLRVGMKKCVKFRPAGIRYPDRPARSQSLYRMSYRAHLILVQTVPKFKSLKQIRNDINGQLSAS